jgi:acyl carrier protein
MIARQIHDYLVTQAGVDPAKLEQPDLMVADLGIDSLSMVEMLFEVEDRHGFQIDDAMQFSKLSYAEMLQAIEAQVRAHHNGEIPAAQTGGQSGGHAA